MGKGQKPCLRRGKPAVAGISQQFARRTPQPQQSIAVGRFGANRAADSGSPQPLRRGQNRRGNRHIGGRRRRKYPAVPTRCRWRRLGGHSVQTAGATAFLARRFRRGGVRPAGRVLRRVHRLYLRRAGAHQCGTAAAAGRVRCCVVRRRGHALAAHYQRFRLAGSTFRRHCQPVFAQPQRHQHRRSRRRVRDDPRRRRREPAALGLRRQQRRPSYVVPAPRRTRRDAGFSGSLKSRGIAARKHRLD